MILAVLRLHVAGSLPSTCLLKRIYGLKEDVSWRIPRWLFSAWLSLIGEYGNFSFSESLCCLRHPIKFLLKRIFGLEEVV